MKAFKGVSSAVPMAHGSSLTERKVTLTRNLKKLLCKFEKFASFSNTFSKYNASASLNTRGKYST